MQHLGTLWKIANAASEVAELARSSETFRFNVRDDVTLYLHLAGAEVRVRRWDAPRIEVTAQLQAPFGWRIKTDQDDVGVYMVALRRAVVGGLAGAVFTVSAPRGAHLLVRLENGRLLLDDVTGTFQLPPLAPGGELTLKPERD